MTKRGKTRHTQDGRLSERVSVWRKQAKWVMETIEKIHRSPSAHGTKWKHKMVLHYGSQYKTMRKEAPRTCRKTAQEYDLRLSTILSEY